MHHHDIYEHQTKIAYHMKQHAFLINTKYFNAILMAFKLAILIRKTFIMLFNTDLVNKTHMKYYNISDNNIKATSENLRVIYADFEKAFDRFLRSISFVNSFLFDQSCAKLQCYLNSLYQWCKENYMSNSNSTRTNLIKDLDVFFDSKLSFNNHSALKILYFKLCTYNIIQNRSLSTIQNKFLKYFSHKFHY
ncbi:putative RNA-directed DNA polymerase [Aphis craccivora]|uniref:Putative RNA-directed DNA polymerase n=1 Tax=Aphis craccivora TaxID=307492 RepID=A0A6G0ZED7_APHCR|nr:putative RNA-directed DNA polymerase [Aphis craccivora]